MSTKIKGPRVAQHVSIIDGIATNILSMGYVDRILIVVTDSGKMGNLILAEKEPTPPMDEVTYSVKPLMGSDMQRDPIPQILARQLVEVISKTDDRPLLLSVVFRKSRNVTRETLRSVLKSIVENCCVWVPVVCSS